MRETPLEDNCVEAPLVTRSRRQALGIRWMVVFFSLVLLLDALLGDRGLARTIKSRQEIRQTAESLERLRHENASLRDDVRRLQEDPATLEALARRELGLIRRGEILVVLKDLN